MSVYGTCSAPKSPWHAGRSQLLRLQGDQVLHHDEVEPDFGDDVEAPGDWHGLPRGRVPLTPKKTLELQTCLVLQSKPQKKW